MQKAKLVKATDFRPTPHPQYPNTDVKNFLTHEQPDRLSVHLLEVKPGGEVTGHTHESQWGTAYLIDGQGAVLINDQWEKASAGDCLLIPPGARHGFRNEQSNRSLVILTCFAPPLV